jgi:hypothetical protein
VYIPSLHLSSLHLTLFLFLFLLFSDLQTDPEVSFHHRFSLYIEPFSSTTKKDHTKFVCLPMMRCSYLYTHHPFSVCRYRLYIFVEGKKYPHNTITTFIFFTSNFFLFIFFTFYRHADRSRGKFSPQIFSIYRTFVSYNQKRPHKIVCLPMMQCSYLHMPTILFSVCSYQLYIFVEGEKIPTENTFNNSYNVDYRPYIFVLTEFVQQCVTSTHNLFLQMHLSHKKISPMLLHRLFS